MSQSPFCHISNRLWMPTTCNYCRVSGPGLRFTFLYLVNMTQRIPEIFKGWKTRCATPLASYQICIHKFLLFCLSSVHHLCWPVWTYNNPDEAIKFPSQSQPWRRSILSSSIRWQVPAFITVCICFLMGMDLCLWVNADIIESEESACSLLCLFESFSVFHEGSLWCFISVNPQKMKHYLDFTLFCYKR